VLDQAGPGLHLGLIEAKDQRGRELRSRWAYQAPNGQQYFQLEIPEGSTALDLRFAVQRTQRVEFLVRPSGRAR
jgi:hypothetical protein